MYERKGEFMHNARGSTKTVYDQLCALGDDPNIDAVAEAIGNKSWSYLTCEGCTEYVKTAVAIGEHEPKLYCDICIREAMELLCSDTKL